MILYRFLELTEDKTFPSMDGKTKKLTLPLSQIRKILNQAEMQTPPEVPVGDGRQQRREQPGGRPQYGRYIKMLKAEYAVPARGSALTAESRTLAHSILHRLAIASTKHQVLETYSFRQNHSHHHFTGGCR